MRFLESFNRDSRDARNQIHRKPAAGNPHESRDHASLSSGVLMDPPVVAVQEGTTNKNAGGHASRLKFSEDGRLVLKRTSVEEAHVYSWLRALAEEGAIDPTCPLGCSDSTCPLSGLHAHAAPKENIKKDAIHSARLLLRWMPEATRISKMADTSQPQVTSDSALIELESLLSGLSDPFVIDIKMGTRLHGDHASPAKIRRATKYARDRGAEELGISFCGLWGEEEGKEYKWEGGSRLKSGHFRPTTLGKYVELFGAFLSSGGNPVQVSRQLLEMLKELRQVWKEQNILNLYGSSLLIVGGFLHPDNKERVVRMKMIDFAHATIQPHEKDMGYLKGIDSLVTAISQAADSISDHMEEERGGLRQLVELWSSRGEMQ